MELADIGKTFRRLDYETKVTGRAQYLGGHERAGHVSREDSCAARMPHARIKSIDASKATQSSRRRGGDYPR